MRIRHTVIFTFYKTTSREEIPSIESLGTHASSETHKRVVELTSKVCDWMTVDTIVPEST